MQIIHIKKKNKYEITKKLRLNFLVDSAFAVSRPVTVTVKQQICDLFTYYPVNGSCCCEWFVQAASAFGLSKGDMIPLDEFLRERKQSFLSGSFLVQQWVKLGRFSSWHIVSRKILSCEKWEKKLIGVRIPFYSSALSEETTFSQQAPTCINSQFLSLLPPALTAVRIRPTS